MDDSKLSIAILSVHSCPAGQLGARDTGGMSVYIREVARALSEQGHGVDIYTQLHNPEDACVTTLGRDTRLIHLEAGQDRRVPKLALYASLPEFAANLENYRVEHRRRYDLVFSHYWLSGWVGESLRAWWQVPHLMVFHTLGAIKNAIGIGETEPEIRLETERRLARSCPRLIATTEREKTALVGHYGALPERVGVVPCGVNLDLFRPGDARAARQRLGLGEEKLILYVGRIEPLKGLDQLIEATACLPGEPPRLVVIGGDDSSQPEIARLKALAGSLGLGGSVTFRGLVPQEDLPDYYRAADVSVVPSYYESFSLVALESLACGTPVVATDVGDLRSIIRDGETGDVVSDNQPRHLADKIARRLARPRPDRAAALAIRATVAPLGWPNIAQAVMRESRRIPGPHLARVL